jgi:hypothetical protein
MTAAAPVAQQCRMPLLSDRSGPRLIESEDQFPKVGIKSRRIEPPMNSRRIELSGMRSGP